MSLREPQERNFAPKVGDLLSIDIHLKKDSLVSYTTNLHSC